MQMNKEATQRALAEAYRLDAKPRAVARSNRDPSWHLVHSGARAEAVAQRNLQANGYEVYFPQLRTFEKPKASRLSKAQRKNLAMLRTVRVRALFPRYLFVRFDLRADAWHEIFKFIGVQGIFCRDNQPVAVPDVMVDGLKAREKDGAIDGKTMTVLDLFKLGEQVQVTSGPFAMFTGTIDRLDESGRVNLLVAFFGRVTPVELTVDQLDKL